MALISVVGSPFDKVLLQDLTKKQSLREHTINPPGQERYIHPVDDDGELTANLEALGATALDSELATFIANTIGEDNISVATIITQADALAGVTGTTSGEAEAIQALISYDFVETGKFLLSFNDGVLAKLNELGWIKVFVADGTALFTL